ncbi:MAG: hypothetical protein F4Y63_09890 [Chloroflexi bacterium]|nr:hypothetical protein [Chloroflexota bacterium]MYF79304.1 hypothetical protein [Chloroflexota bacterium]MYK62129.1 hypothetical protein [Chloroflexota bacterium]
MTNIAGPGKEISEKTLELNICAEMLYRIRSWPHCDRALWHGMTQHQERHNGLDQLIRNTGIGSSLMLQFKSPWPTSRVDSLYRFTINERQHEALEDLARRYPRAVYYVLPLYTTWEKANNHSPDLIRDTWLMPVASIPLASLTSQPALSSGRHRVDVGRDGSQTVATVHSPTIEADLINAGTFFTDSGNPRMFRDQMDMVPSDALQKWVATRDRNGLSVRFSGLKALYVPQSYALAV